MGIWARGQCLSLESQLSEQKETASAWGPQEWKALGVSRDPVGVDRKACSSAVLCPALPSGRRSQVRK